MHIKLISVKFYTCNNQGFLQVDQAKTACIAKLPSEIDICIVVGEGETVTDLNRFVFPLQCKLEASLKQYKKHKKYEIQT
jgi:hypothetical protein